MALIRAVVAAILIAAQADGAAALPPLSMVEVAPGVFVHPAPVALASPENRGDIANVGFVVGDEAVAVIDAGGSREVGGALLAAVRARTDLPVRWLVLTHMHPDHVFGASVFKEAGATVIGHARLPAALASRAESYEAALLRQIGPEAARGTRLVLPDEVVAGRRSIDLGGRVLDLEAFPTGHTDNDLGVMDRATGTWWLGDVVFDRHLPSVDGSITGWVDLLDRLAGEPAARVVPGHGSPSLPWPSGADPLRQYLEALVAETRTALAEGESLGTATRHLGEDLRDGWELFDDFNAQNATAAYRELEWE